MIRSVRSCPVAVRGLVRNRRTWECPELDLTAIGMLERSGQHTGRLNAGSQNLDESYIHRQNLQEMEVSCRSGYCGDQSSVQGVGQLDSMSPIRDGYFGNQQVMQGLGHLDPEATHDARYNNPQNMQGLGQLGFSAPTLPNCFDLQDSLQDMEQTMGSAQFDSISSSKHLRD